MIFKKNLNKSEVQKEVSLLDNLQPWNHNIKITEGLYTKPGDYSSFGKNERKIERLSFLKTLIEGNDVLDIGCNEGFFSIKFLEWGAKSVQGIDIDTLRLKKANFIKSLLNENFANRWEIIESSVYDLNFEKFNQKIVFALGFIHRLPEPFEFLKDVLSLPSEYFVFEFKTTRIDILDRYRAVEFSPYSIDQEDFYGTEFFRFSKSAFESMVRRISPELEIKFIDNLNQQRVIAVVGRKLERVKVPRNKSQTHLLFLMLIKRFVKDLYLLCIKSLR